ATIHHAINQHGNIKIVVLIVRRCHPLRRTLSSWHPLISLITLLRRVSDAWCRTCCAPVPDFSRHRYPVCHARCDSERRAGLSHVPHAPVRRCVPEGCVLRRGCKRSPRSGSRGEREPPCVKPNSVSWASSS